jgi:hypothetical protein
MTVRHALTRRSALHAAAALTALVSTGLAAAAPRPRIEVYKSPTCGCCKDWMLVLESAGFDVRGIDSGNTAARQRAGIAQALGSCHTAFVEGYAIEGHVPPGDIRRLLRERPAAIGLAVPGMPVGSPGMDGPAYGGRRDPYDVLLVLAGGGTRIWSSHR